MEPLSFQRYICSLDPTILPRVLRICSGVYFQVRRDLVKVPSTLEVDVEDVTEEAQHVRFARPLLLSEVLAMEEAMPAQAEILEGPVGPAVFESAWERRLRRGQQLHGRSRAWRVLASAPSSGRHFLLSSAYQGRFRRRPRRFAAVRELAAALEPGRRLRLVVTQDCEGRAGDVVPLAVGDRLEVQRLQGSGAGIRLLCHRRGGEEDEEEEGEELLLPLDVSGGFVEEASDSKKYSLPELLQRQPLPCEVRLAAPDPALGRDALAALPALRLEELLDQPFLVGSFCEQPEEGFEIPARWLDLSVLLSEGPVRPLAPCTLHSRLEELTEAFYYRLLAQLPGSAAPPPPRPPKPARSGTGPGGRRPAVSRSPAPVRGRPGPPLPPLPNPHGPSAPGAAGTDSDSTEHDYETVDNSMQKTIHKMQTIFPF
ncbi:protein THEMIS2 [Indicator indicator]|uniref:protein THEMIS2 n=1 Tax=Indicator indicator TaxID=1002788 RepID=UPI0023DF5EA3|nr:protein THEMIS2 [Indicator indicator]